MHKVSVYISGTTLSSLTVLMLLKTFLFQGLLWNCLFFSKALLRTFLVICPRPKLCFCTPSILFTTYLAFNQINCHFWVTIILLVDFMYLTRCLLLKVHMSLIFSYKWQGRLFPPHGLNLPTSSNSGNCHLTKCVFKFLYFWNQSEECQEILSYAHRQMQEWHVILLKSF